MSFFRQPFSLDIAALSTAELKMLLEVAPKWQEKKEKKKEVFLEEHKEQTAPRMQVAQAGSLAVRGFNFWPALKWSESWIR